MELEKIDADVTNSEKIEELIDKHKYGEALSRLKEILKKDTNNGHLHYLFAFCLVKSIMDSQKALYHYGLALKYGYAQFRVLRARGSLYFKLGDFDAARIDFRNALFLNPLDEHLRQSLQRLPHVESAEKQGDIELFSPVLITTVPKSGTVLLKNILLSILGERRFVRYLATNEYLQTVTELKNRVYFGHIWYSDELAKKVSSIPKIILIRDPRDNVVSHAHFLNSNTEQYWTISEYEESWNKKSWDEKLSSVIFGMSTPNNYPQSILNVYLNYALKWLGSRTLVIRYEDLVGSRFGGVDAKVISTIKSLMEFIGIKNIDEETLAKKIHAAADPTKSNTFRSGNLRAWREEFRPSHVKQMKIAAPGLVSILGYEPDESWDINQVPKTSKRTLAKFETSSTIDCGYSLLKIDTESLMEFCSRRRTLTWDEYLEIRSEFGTSSQAGNIIDEWALKLFIETEQLEHALYLLERFIQMAPNNSRWNYDYAFSTHRLRKDLQKALQYYDMALQNGFDEFWVRYNRGILFKELGDLENARVDFQQALTLNPDHKVAQKMLHDIDETIDSKQLHLALSQVQEFVSNSEHDRARVSLEQLLKKFPCNADLNYLYGFCLHVLKRDLDKALSYYTLALENGFDEFWIKYNRGILLHNLGNKDAALADLECALKLRPDHKGPEIVLRQIKTEPYYGDDDK